MTQPTIRASGISIFGYKEHRPSAALGELRNCCDCAISLRSIMAAGVYVHFLGGGVCGDKQEAKE